MDNKNNNKNIKGNGTAPPEFWLRLGYMTAAAYGKSSKIGIGYDDTAQSRISADTVSSGVRFGGANAMRFGVISLPVMRAAARFYGTDISVYIAAADDGRAVTLRLLDSSGTEIRLKDTFSDEAIRVLRGGIPLTSLDKVGIMGSEVEQSGFSEYYRRGIINSIKSKSFGMNVCLKTGVKTVANFVEELLGELYPRLDDGAELGFSAVISECGEYITLESPSGEILDRDRTVKLMLYVLVKGCGLKTLVLPEHLSESAEDLILSMGGSVVRCGDTDADIMRKINAYGSKTQLLMMYDGVYAAVRILDFLCLNNISFDELCALLPRIFTEEAEVELNSRSSDEIIETLKTELKAAPKSGGRGIRIEADGSVAVIVPTDGAKIRIVTESESTEAAAEITSFLKNKIKMLAKS